MSNVVLADFLKTEPDGTLETIAKQYDTTLLDVVRHLPDMALTTGKHFDLVWDAVHTWGNVTTLVHTQDVILEFSGELPSGFHRHGYFNLRGKKGMTGHIKAENCTYIALVERKFMGMDTLARTVVQPAEMPVGLLTSLIGGPYFLWLILRVRRMA